MMQGPLVEAGSLGSHLRLLRMRRGLSVSGAAKLAGIQRQTLADVERGERKPHDATLSKLSVAYNVPIEDILSQKEDDFDDRDMNDAAEDAEVRRMIHEQRVQQLLFAFQVLDWLGYKPSSNGDNFWIGDEQGNTLSRAELERFTTIVGQLKDMAPLAVDAMHRRGTPGQGTDAGGALLEAYARWSGE
jgi:transcriptional regulator with XRE-family HTH domain